MGLGAVRHREALLVFGLADRVVSHAHPCEGLSGLQQFNVEILLRPAKALANLALDSNCRRWKPRGCLANDRPLPSHRDPAPGRVMRLARWRHSTSLVQERSGTVAATRATSDIYTISTQHPTARNASSITNLRDASLPRQ